LHVAGINTLLKAENVIIRHKKRQDRFAARSVDQTRGESNGSRLHMGLVKSI